jgi:hypothetical protein
LKLHVLFHRRIRRLLFFAGNEGKGYSAVKALQSFNGLQCTREKKVHCSAKTGSEKTGSPFSPGILQCAIVSGKNLVDNPIPALPQPTGSAGMYEYLLHNYLFCPELGPDLLGKVFSDFRRMHEILIDF